jgi:predicted metal-binding protein
MDHLRNYTASIGIKTCVSFTPTLLRPEERIRELCRVNRCGKYRKHYMCPPYVGSLDDIRRRLAPFRHGVLLQHQTPLDVKNDREGLRNSKIAFHQMVLETEAHLKTHGAKTVWGMIGGDCTLCRTCLARIDAPCPYPNRARTSLESIGVDVMSLLDSFSLDKGFHPDKITWTGCVLY